MRLSVILLVAVAFVASLNSAAGSDAKIVVAATPTNVHDSTASNRFLRARNEDVKDERNEEDSDDEKDNDEEEERGWFTSVSEATTALSAFKKLVTQSGDDLVEAVSGLSKTEINALFNQGHSQMAKMVPGFYPGMDLSDFMSVVRAAGVSDDMENALVVGYGKYLAHQMR